MSLLHLLIVDRTRGAALVSSYGTRWLLPTIRCGERTRAGPLAAAWASARGIKADIAGQWVGRITLGATDWLVTMDAWTPAVCAAPAPLEWRSIENLARETAVADYQQWAIARVVKGSDVSVPGPFGNLAWPARIRAWIAEATGSAAAGLTPYRVSPHEVVVGADTPHGRVYAKGLSPDRDREVQVTRWLSSVSPDSFAPTLAVSRHQDSVWWLMAACRGRPLRDVRDASAALARIQQLVLSVDPRMRRLPPIDLDAAGRWAAELLGASADAAWARDACTRAAAADVARGWIPMDLDAGNILIDGERVRFIDVDDSFAGPAPLPMALLGRRCADAGGRDDYAEAWQPKLRAVDWRAMEAAASVVESWLGWERLRSHVRRGEVHISLELATARIRDGLIARLHSR